MIFELRTYDLKVGRVRDYLDIFAEKGFPVLSRYAAPVGFWFTGAVGTGAVDQVNHIWGYESVEARIERRTALYADPDWSQKLVPLVFETFVRLRGQLLELDPAAEGVLEAAWRAALPAEQPGRPVVAGMAPPGAERATTGSIGAWRTITGTVGRTLTLDYLADADLSHGGEGSTREIWLPAAFSRLR